MRLCPCGATITQHMTTTKEVWNCTGCKRREVFSFTKVKKPIKIKKSSADTQDTMRPFSHALPFRGD
jgi:ribosomal protein L34E